MKAFARERQIRTCFRQGEEKKEVELNTMTEGRKLFYGSGRGRTRKALTAPKQANLNDRRAWIYFQRLVDMNFGIGDYHLTLTYDNAHLPASPEEAKKDYDRFLERAKKLYKKHGIKFECIMVMSYSSGKTGDITRLHFHIILRGGVDRTEVEHLWRAADKPGRAKPGHEKERRGEALGYANCDRLQPDGNGLAALMAYLKKQPREGIARRWYATLGLKKPVAYAPNDDKYSIADLKKIATDNADMPRVDFWEKRYPGWTLQDNYNYAYNCTVSELSGVSIRIKLRRLTTVEIEDRRNKRKEARIGKNR